MREKSNPGAEEAPAEGAAEQQEQQAQAARIRTFTRWMNLLLQKCDPPLVVHDLLAEVRDGRVLMALLEQLSGCKLLYRFRSSPQRIFRLNNISKVMSFLDDKHVKLSGVDLSGIADGVPSAVLNLVWSIILHFQVKLAVRGLRGHLSSSRSSSGPGNLSSEPPLRAEDSSGYSRHAAPRKGRGADVEPKPRGKTVRTLLQLVQTLTSRFGVQVQDFGRSWSSGVAIVALIKSINPALADLSESFSSDPRRNVQLAFEIAHRCLGIPPLLESDDLLCASPDEQCVITYVSMFLGHYAPTGDCAMNGDVPEIPNRESLEPVSLGETQAHDPEAQALLKGLESSSEQLLWKKWSRRPSGVSEQPAGCAATAPAGRRRSAANPPSPLDAGVQSQEIQSWMKEADRTYGKRRQGGSCLSLSSEEGIYSLSALDSEDEEEEEAASHTPDLSQQVSPPLASRARLEAAETAKSEALETYESEEDESGRRGTVRSTDVFDSQTEEKNKSRGGECGARRVVKVASNDGGSRHCEEVTGNAGLVTHTWDKSPSEADETRRMGAFEAPGRRREPRQQSGRGPREAASETTKEDDSLTALGGARDEMGKIKRRGCWREGGDGRGACEVTGGGGEVGAHAERRRDGGVKADDLTCEGRPGEGHSGGAKSPVDLTPITGAKGRNGESKTDGFEFQATENKVHSGDILWPQTCSATDQSPREAGVTLEAALARCDITPLQLETLLALWIVIYCCFVLHQMNS